MKENRKGKKEEKKIWDFLSLSLKVPQVGIKGISWPALSLHQYALPDSGSLKFGQGTIKVRKKR